MITRTRGIAATARHDQHARESVPGQWLIDATAALGDTCKKKLAGPGEPEAAIRAPIEELLAAAGQHLSLTVVPHDEVRDNDRGVRTRLRHQRQRRHHRLRRN